MKNRIKKFVRDHRDEFIFLGGMVVATGYMSVIGRKTVDGMNVKGATIYTKDGEDVLMVTHKNGKVSKLKHAKK